MHGLAMCILDTNFFMNLLLIFLGRARIETRIKVIVILYSIVAVLMVVLQYERKEMLLTSAANMLFILMIYMAMQNPSAYIDSETGTSDEQAFLIQMKNVTEQSGKKSISCGTYQTDASYRNAFRI